MNTVRPLVTITILVVVGAYLYVKINEGPARPVGDSHVWQSEAAEDVPPLDTSAGSPSSATEVAPPWPPAARAADPSSPRETADKPADTIPAGVATSDMPSSTDVTAQSLPAIPEIPALPEVSSPQTMAESAPIAAVPAPNELPANIPTARYPDQSAPSAEPETTPVATDTVDLAPPVSQNALEPASPAAAGASAQNTTTLSNPQTVATPSSSAPNPLRQAEQAPPPQGDPYASIYRQNPAVGEASAPAQPSLAASWPEIQKALDQGRLSQAHQMLSRWYDDPSLTPAEATKVEALLSQLAGTVVYSTEHQLEPARVVKPGETLETIAQEYNVPWQLLAKINGVPSADHVRPGQELKVVRGPFSAVVDLKRSQLTLMVDGRYAGKFPITVPTGFVVNEGEWVIQGKPEASPPASNYGTIQSATAPALGSRQLMLTSAEATTPTSGSPLMIGSRPALDPNVQRAEAGSPMPMGSVPYLAVSPSDAEELADILSIGSRVMVRR